MPGVLVAAKPIFKQGIFLGMGTFFLILAVIIVNGLLWLWFMARFKKLFSTDGLIETTKNEINNIVKDINGQTLRDMNLMDEKIQQLKSAVANAEEILKKADEFLRSKEAKEIQKQSMKADFQTMNAFAQPVQSAQPWGSQQFQAPPAQPTQPITQPRQIRTSSKTFDPGNMAYEVLQQGMPDLFDGISDTLPTSGGSVVVRNDGASYAKVPIVEMKEAEADFPSQVRSLHIEGKDVSEIARILGCSPVEVELVLNI